jgi:hypothetical protein
MDKRIKKYIFIFSLFIFINATPLNNGYKNIKLGMTQSEVKKILQNSPDFVAVKEEILSIRISPDTEIISTEGTGFIQLAYFHFNEDRLYQIFLKIDENKVGYYYLLQNLTKKYGKTAGFSPDRVYWEDHDTKIILEKPCSLKYFHMSIWNSIKSQDETDDTVLEKVRKRFIDDL